MPIEVRQEAHASLDSYAAISAAFEVREIVDVAALRPGATILSTLASSSPWTKDYDALAGNDPATWPAKFNIEHWRFLAAYTKDVRVGGAVVVVRPDDVVQLGGRAAYAIVWDLRVAPESRRQGVGRALLAAAAAVASEAGCAGVEVETQDVNVPACRLYAAAGYRIREVTPSAYPKAPHETRLIWERQTISQPRLAEHTVASAVRDGRLSMTRRSISGSPLPLEGSMVVQHLSPRSVLTEPTPPVV